ncbi:MAG: 50S ribosomal protein L11 methyltransferase [Alistipes sp.]|nr:50S ribosomal protein L11 methyltransferase [Alistipes sp.]
MDHIEITTPCLCTEDAEILMAELADFPFDGFEVTDTGLKSYIAEADLEANMHEITAVLRATGTKSACRTIGERNWNAEWEASFEPIRMGNVMVRAPFHEAAGDGVTDIVIMPKMSFGTGHHETTRLMIALMERLDMTGKTVLDMGSGTGILAILAAKRGADPVDAVDIDRWAFENCRENIADNGVQDRIMPILGDAAAIDGKRYDVILANINRNILCRDMGRYAAALRPEGTLVISGILDTDLMAVDGAAAECGLSRVDEAAEAGWCAAVYRKNPAPHPDKSV